MSLLLETRSMERIIVRVPNWVGDAVMCTAALQMLREIFPSASIALLARPAIADLLRSQKYVDEILVYDHKGIHAGLTGKMSLISLLRKKRYDVAVLFQNALEAALLVWLAGIPHRIGYPTDGRGCLLNYVVPLSPHVNSLHHVEYYQRLVASIDETQKRKSPTLTVQREEDAKIAEKLEGMGVKEEDTLIGLNPGSMYGGAKRWLPERFAETADRLIENSFFQGNGLGEIHCVIVGAIGEEELGRTIAENMRNAPIVFSGKTSIPALIALIKRCRIFLTNDTGPMHIANALGVPVVAIFGPTDHRNTSPYQGSFSIVRHPVDCSPCLLRECPIDHRCMTQVSVADVVKAAEELVCPPGAHRMIVD